LIENRSAYAPFKLRLHAFFARSKMGINKQGCNQVSKKKALNESAPYQYPM
jgi:hypothetical protein